MVQGLRRALNKLDAAVGLTQHHDAITGTAKQAVTNDYARRLAAASAAVHKHIARLISAAIFTPHACASCMASPPSAGPASDLSECSSATCSGPAATSGDAAAGGQADADDGAHQRSCDALGEDGSVQESPGDSVGAAGGSKRAAGGPAADALPRLWPCEQGNVSACTATVEASRSCESFAVVLFNSAAWPRDGNVRVRTLRSLRPQCGIGTAELVPGELTPVQELDVYCDRAHRPTLLRCVLSRAAAAIRNIVVQVPLARPDCHYAAVDANSQEVLLGVLPVSQATWCVQELLALYDALPAAASGWYEAVFQAFVPAVGYSTVLLIPNAAPAALAANATLPDMHALDTAAASTAVSFMPLPDVAHAWHDASCPDCAAVALRAGAALARVAPAVPALPGAAAIIENEHLALRFDRVTGRLASVVHKESGQRVRVDIDLVYWESKTEAPFGGAYIMRPGAQV